MNEMKSICWTNECPERYLVNIGADTWRRTPPNSLRHNHMLETIMALSLPGERSLAAATPVNPLAAFARWIAKAQAARTRRVALSALLELDHARLADLGISRDDIARRCCAQAQRAGLGAQRCPRPQRPPLIYSYCAGPTACRRHLVGTNTFTSARAISRAGFAAGLVS